MPAGIVALNHESTGVTNLIVIYRGSAVIIDDKTNNDLLFPKTHPCGTVERDYSVQPLEMFSAPSQIKLLPEFKDPNKPDWSGIDARIDEQEKTQSSLEHMWNRAKIDCLDQNGQRFCWAYDVAHQVMLQRLASGMNVPRLSGHAIGCMVKNFRDEGGWVGLAAEFVRGRGCPSVQTWQEKSMSRSNDNPATWADAAKYKITEDVVDLTRAVYDQNLSIPLIFTLLLQNIPVGTDWRFWGHSVAAVRIVRIERGRYGIRILNSWTPTWGERGFGTIDYAAKGAPMGAVATVMTMAA